MQPAIITKARVVKVADAWRPFGRRKARPINGRWTSGTVTFGGANSLDNYIARPDHAVDWLMWGKEAAAVMADFWKTIDTVLMGADLRGGSPERPRRRQLPRDDDLRVLADPIGGLPRGCYPGERGCGRVRAS